MEVYENCAPTVCREIKISDRSNGWFCKEVQVAKANLRRAEKHMKKNKSNESKLEYRRLRKIKDDVIQNSKENFFRNKIENCSSDPKLLYKQLNHLLGRDNNNNDLPEHSSKKELADEFKNYF